MAMGRPANPSVEVAPSPGWSSPAQAPWLLRPVGALVTWQMHRLNR